MKIEIGGACRLTSPDGTEMDAVLIKNSLHGLCFKIKGTKDMGLPLSSAINNGWKIGETR